VGIVFGNNWNQCGNHYRREEPEFTSEIRTAIHNAWGRFTAYNNLLRDAREPSCPPVRVELAEPQPWNPRGNESIRLLVRWDATGRAYDLFLSQNNSVLEIFNITG
jgi:hypothetical protein